MNLLVILGAAWTKRHADAATFVPGVGLSASRFAAQNTTVGVMDSSVWLQWKFVGKG